MFNPLDAPVERRQDPATTPPQTHKFLKRSVAEALSECVRELQVRDRCYDRWVKEGKLSDVDATDRKERLEMACHVLAIVRDLDCYASLIGTWDAQELARKTIIEVGGTPPF